MNGTADDLYFEWLYSKVASVDNENPHRSYWRLMRVFYSTKFIWFIPNDDNRVADGKDLRDDFSSETGVYPDISWLELDCSMLEMLLGLSQRASFGYGGSPLEWFWHFVKNLELQRYSDDIFEVSIEEEANDALLRINDRSYSSDGTGGLFPLRYARQDQRKVELWYQMSAYLIQAEEYGLQL